MPEITKEQFDAVYNKHLPNKWTEFVYKYLIKRINKLMYVLLAIVCLGLVFTIIETPRIFIAIPTYIFLIVFGIATLCSFTAIFFNNIRIDRICKELKISKIEYNILIEKYYS